MFTPGAWYARTRLSLEILHTALTWSAKNVALQALLEGICATLDLHFQALSRSEIQIKIFI